MLRKCEVCLSYTAAGSWKCLWQTQQRPPVCICAKGPLVRISLAVCLVDRPPMPPQPQSKSLSTTRVTRRDHPLHRACSRCSRACTSSKAPSASAASAASASCFTRRRRLPRCRLRRRLLRRRQPAAAPACARRLHLQHSLALRLRRSTQAGANGAETGTVSQHPSSLPANHKSDAPGVAPLTARVTRRPTTVLRLFGRALAAHRSDFLSGPCFCSGAEISAVPSSLIVMV